MSTGQHLRSSAARSWRTLNGANDVSKGIVTLAGSGVTKALAKIPCCVWYLCASLTMLSFQHEYEDAHFSSVVES